MKRSQAANGLQADLNNIAYHIFGHHGRCSDTFCKAAAEKKASSLQDTEHIDEEAEVDPIDETARLWEELSDEQVLEEARLDLLDGPIVIGSIGIYNQSCEMFIRPFLRYLDTDHLIFGVGGHPFVLCIRI